MPGPVTRRAFGATVGLGLAAGLLACRPTGTRPPYSISRVPEVGELIAATAPRIRALQVPAAKVRLNRSVSANLMLIAQAPARFSGQIHVSGKELMSLAFHEQGYTLRNVSDRGNLPIGFYEGTHTRCAIAPLLGLSLAPEELVRVVLGGIPDFPEVHTEFVEVVHQAWDGDRNAEVLRLRKGAYERELQFTWFEGAWWPTGAKQWRRQNNALEWMWTLEHQGLHKVTDAALPGRTRITRPGTNGQTQTVVITYRKQLANPTSPGATPGGGPSMTSVLAGAAVGIAAVTAPVRSAASSAAFSKRSSIAFS